jgi:hypothetical protein
MLTGRSLAAGDRRRSRFRGYRADLAGENELQLDGEPIGGGARTKWSSEHHWRRVRASVNDGDRCGNSIGRDGGDREYWNDQKLTTMPRSWSARSQEVGHRRSTATKLQDTELVDTD